MNFTKLMKSLFGDKSTRDMKLIQPYVDKIKAAYPAIKELSNDDLRAKTKEIQQYVQDAGKQQREEIAKLRERIEDTPIDEREDIFNKIDKLEKEALDNYEKALDEVMPIAFSIVKDTARRFTENEETIVTQTTSTVSLQPRLSTTTTGQQAATTSSGKWFTTTFSFSAVRYSTKVRLPKWQRVKVRPSWLPCQSSSTL